MIIGVVKELKEQENRCHDPCGVDTLQLASSGPD